MKYISTTSELAAQINANEIWAALFPKKANQILRANEAMKKRLFEITSIDERIENMSDKELLRELEVNH